MPVSRWLLGVVLLLACAGAAPPPPTREVPAPLPQAEPCPDPHRAPEGWLTDGPLLVGELHGTAETPRLVLSVVCQASRDGGEVQLGLEIPRGEQARLDAFLRTGDRTALLASEHWTRAYQDGRSSVAFLELLEAARRLRLQGGKVSLFAYDVDAKVPDRDLAMAQEIHRRSLLSPAPMVILVGSIHARTTVALPRPMGFRLIGLGLRPHSLLVEAEGGEAWLCHTRDASSCGPHPGGRPTSTPAPVGQFSSPVTGMRGYEARFLFARFTASPPAVPSSSSPSSGPEASPAGRPPASSSGQ
ncbi:MAG: ChaN family lipoprotein [Myxococcota bacterium]|nr:ChaN family lipoprotein [Myxococcota bacterium]